MLDDASATTISTVTKARLRLFAWLERTDTPSFHLKLTSCAEKETKGEGEETERERKKDTIRKGKKKIVEDAKNRKNKNKE